MKVVSTINFEIYSIENRKSLKAFKQGCQTIILGFQKIFSVVDRVGDDFEGVGGGNRSRATEALPAVTG